MKHEVLIEIGPSVTNPAVRDWTVTAGLFGTLNRISGGWTSSSGGAIRRGA